MKRHVVLLLLLASAAPALAQHPVTISVVASPVDLRGVTDMVSFGAGGYGGTLLSNLPQGQPRSTVWNAGYGTIDYTAAARISSGSWRLGTKPGTNTAVLYANFARPLTSADDYTVGYTVSDVDFGPEDCLGSNAVVASWSALAKDGGENEFKGYSISPLDSTRSLRYRLDLPTAGDIGQQVITVVIGAVCR